MSLCCVHIDLYFLKNRNMDKDIPLLDSIDDRHKCDLDAKDFKNHDMCKDAKFSQKAIDEWVKVLKSCNWK